MGVKVTNRAYRNQFYPVAQETDWLIGNVGDWQQLRVEFDVTIDFLASSSETVTLDNINKTIKLNNGKKWYRLWDCCRLWVATGYGHYRLWAVTGYGPLQIYGSLL